jgi:putative Mn2+ efflux pump MntP
MAIPAQGSLIELSPEQYLALSDAKAVALTELANERHKREARYAVLGMMCGTLSLLACIGAFVYLAMNGHKTEAYVVLGAAVLAMIGRIIQSRL